MNSRQCGDCAAQHAHGMGVVSERFHQLSDIGVKEGVLHNFFGESVVLLGCGQFAEDNKESNLQEVGSFGQDFDGVASVL